MIRRIILDKCHDTVIPEDVLEGKIVAFVMDGTIFVLTRKEYKGEFVFVSLYNHWNEWSDGYNSIEKAIKLVGERQTIKSDILEFDNQREFFAYYAEFLTKGRKND